MAHRDVIKRNQSTLCDLLKIYPRFLVKCSERNLLVQDELDVLESLKGFNLNKKLLEFMSAKSEDKFKEIVGIMGHEDCEQSGDVLEILRFQTPNSTSSVQTSVIGNANASSTNSSSNSTTFKIIEHSDCHWIAEHLSNDPEVIEKRRHVFGLLGLKPAEFHGLNKKSEQDYEFFTGCLQKFVARNVRVSISRLDELLKIEFPSAMDAVMSDARAKS